MEPNGSQWTPMDPNGFQWIPMDSNESQWIQVDLPSLADYLVLYLRAAIRIQWTKLKSVPIQLNLDEIRVSHEFYPMPCV